MVALMIALVAVVFLSLGAFAMLGSRALKHIDSTLLSGSTYNLASYTKFGDLSETYLLYQCSPETYCTLIYRDYEYNPDGQPTSAQLLINQKTNTLSIVIDGETIYTYTPE
jgi:hypothetical protein